MTSTSVKDVSTVLQAVKISADTNVQAVGDGGFQAVLGRQTSRSRSEEATNVPDAKANTKRQDAAKPEETVKTEESAGKGVEEAKEPTEEQEKVDGEAVEKAMEILQTTAAELIIKIAETFGISEEEAIQLMDSLEMQPMELLQPGRLSEFLLTVAGAEDSMALLTDEDLYTNFQMIMNAQSDALTESAEIIQMDMEQLKQVISEADSAMKADMPVVEQQEAGEQPPLIQVAVVEEMTGKQGETTKTDNRFTMENGAENSPENSQTGELGGNGQILQRNNQPKSDTGNQHQNSNLLLQQLEEELLSPQLGQASESSIVGDMETQDIMRQIMDYMKVQIKPDMSNLEMQLHPESLGTLQVQVASKGGVVTAQFITQNEAVKAALESQMIQLKESFAEQGVKVEAIEVTVQTHQFERNLDQGRGRQQEASEKRSRGRRIRLDESTMPEGMEELNMDEQLAVQIMSANGGTVDYTA